MAGAEQFEFDVAVIGGGPGGYTAAIRCAQLGMKVLCVESEKLGGTCLNCGCIPSKALLQASHHLNFLRGSTFEKFGIEGVHANSVKPNLAKLMKNKDDIVTELRGGIGMLLKHNNAQHLNGTASFLDKQAVARP